MIELSQQVLKNLAYLPGRYSTRGSSTSISGNFNWYLCAIFVSDTEAFPITHTEMYSYINRAVNGSNFNGGIDAASMPACLGIAELIPTSSIVDGTTVTFDGPSSFTARSSGTIGGVIFTQLYGTASVAPSAIYPMTNATTSTNSNLYMGNSTYHHGPLNYLLVTDSVGTSGAECVTVDSMTLAAGSTYTLYNTSITFKDSSNG